MWKLQYVCIYYFLLQNTIQYNCSIDDTSVKDSLTNCVVDATTIICSQSVEKVKVGDSKQPKKHRKKHHGCGCCFKKKNI